MKHINKNMNRKALALLVSFTTAASCACPLAVFADTAAAKEETVYVVTDAKGNASDVIVSDHLVNNSGSSVIKDSSSLKDIKNVKGDEKFTKKGSSLEWEAAGKDIYYQGRTDKETPVQLNVKYYMNGEEFSGEEIQGKKGDFSIEMNFADENGVPYVVLSGILVKNDKYSNMKVNSGKVIDDGEKTVVAGMAAPGLTDKLGGKARDAVSDAGLGNEIVISGHTTGFDITDIMTVATSNVFEDIDTAEFAKLDYDSQISKLDKGARELVKGSEQLYAGLEKMNESAPVLKKGVNDLDTGAGKLKAGTEKLSASAMTLAGGQASLQMGIQQMYLGIKGNGTAENPGLGAGIRQLTGGADQISAGADKIAAGAGEITGGLDQLKSGVSGAIGQSNGYLDTAVSKSGAAAQSAGTLAATLTANKDQLVELLGEEKYNEMVEQAQTAASDSTEAATAAGTAKAVNGKVNETVAGTADQLKAGINGDGTEANPGIKGGAAAIKNGAASMKGGLGQLDTGVNTILDGFEKDGGLIDGAAQLANGSMALFNGIGKVGSTSPDTIVGGATQLANGMDQLNSKTNVLVAGIRKLTSGSDKLSDGMVQLYEEGISKIVKLYNEDLKGLADGVESTINSAKSYDNFSGKSESMDGTVKFVFKTVVAEQMSN